MFSLGAYWYQYEQRGATHEGFRDVLAHVEQVRGWCLAFPLVLVLLTTTHPFHTPLLLKSPLRGCIQKREQGEVNKGTQTTREKTYSLKNCTTPCTPCQMLFNYKRLSSA